MFENVDSVKEGFFNTDWLAYAGVMAISIWGGVVSFFEKKTKFSWKNFGAHLASSSFAGLVTFLSCQYVGITGPLTGVLCAVAGHMGTPALIALAMKLKPVKAFFETEKKDDSNS